MSSVDPLGRLLIIAGIVLAGAGLAGAASIGACWRRLHRGSTPDPAWVRQRGSATPDDQPDSHSGGALWWICVAVLLGIASGAVATAARVSVVTPFYNTAPYLAECIESVLAQSHGDFEYVLVDNHSDDGGGLTTPTRSNPTKIRGSYRFLHRTGFTLDSPKTAPVKSATSCFARLLDAALAGASNVRRA